MAAANEQARGVRSYAIAKYVALVGLSLGALLIFGPMVSPTLGHWLLSMGVISGVTAERMAWGPIALFGALIPGSIALVVGLISLVIAVVLRVRAHFPQEGPMPPNSALLADASCLELRRSVARQNADVRLQRPDCA